MKTPTIRKIAADTEHREKVRRSIKDLLGWEHTHTRILNKSFGILKLKKTPVAYQREARKEWEGRVKKLERKP
jgi:hypothetical protein